MADKNLESGDQEFSWDEAFEQAVKDIESGDETDLEDTVVQDLNEDPDDLDDNAGADSEKEDDESDVSTDSDSDDEKDAVDWKALYDNAISQAQEYKGRLSDVENKFNSWRGRVEAERAKAPEEVKNTEDTENRSKAIKQFSELYPEVAQPVQLLIEDFVSKKAKELNEKLELVVKKDVEPLKEKVTSAEVRAHDDAIRQAHVDIDTYLHDGSFKRWVDSMPSYQRAGVIYTSTSGSVPEVIELFNVFKQQTGIVKSESQQEKNNNQSASKVKAAMNAMGVRPSKAEPKFQSNKKTLDTMSDSELFEFYSKKIAEDERV